MSWLFKPNDVDDDNREPFSSPPAGYHLYFEVLKVETKKSGLQLDPDTVKEMEELEEELERTIVRRCKLDPGLKAPGFKV